MHHGQVTPKVHLLARAVIADDHHFLLAHQIGASTTFLPGGHAEPGEGLKPCLARELGEEVGLTAVVGRYLGAVEHSWVENGVAHYEVNHCFETSIPLTRTDKVTSREDHLEFLWVHVDDLAVRYLLPSPLRDLLASLDRSETETWWASTVG